MGEARHGEGDPIADRRQPLVEFATRIHKAAAEFTERDHAEAGLVADQDDVAGQLRERIEQALALAFEPLCGAAKQIREPQGQAFDDESALRRCLCAQR